MMCKVCRHHFVYESKYDRIEMCFRKEFHTSHYDQEITRKGGLCPEYDDGGIEYEELEYPPDAEISWT